MRIALSALAIALLQLPTAAQEASPTASPLSFLATLSLDSGRSPLPASVGAAGPLFLLAPIVAGLGGELHTGPLEESHRLRIAGTDITLGPGSSFMTVGQELVALSQTPRASEAGLHVPLDMLDKSYGELMGFEFEWDAPMRSLTVRRRAPRSIEVSVQVVHLQGVTTVVLEFDQAPRYRVITDDEGIRIEVDTDTLRARRSPPLDPGSLVRQIEIAPRSILLHLAAGAKAAEPYVLARSSDPRRRHGYRLVFDVSLQRQESASAQPGVRRKPSTRRLKTIVLDPGHGGEELGAVGPTGAEEKALTLILSKALKRKLEARLPVRVVLTRNEDTDLPLDTRTALANQNKADLFLSIHLNSSPDPATRGAETYFLSMEASDPEAARLAESENRGGPSETMEQGDEFGLQLILWDLAQSQHLAASQRLAGLVQGELDEALGLRNRGVRQAPFAVLMGASMPAILLELGFLTNAEEEERLQDPSYRSALLDGVVRAVVRFEAQRLAAGRQAAAQGSG